MATANTQGAVTLWRTDQYNHLADLHGHNGGIRSLAFSPNSQSLAAAGADNDVTIWDVGTRARRATLTGHTGPVNAAAWNTEGTLLATASTDRTITIWPINADLAIRHLCGILTTEFPTHAQPQPVACR